MTQPVILVVDDDPAIVRVAELCLAADGMQVRTARTGEDALALLRDEAVDLVVLDVKMPRMEGFEVLRRIRARSNVPVIMLTAQAGELDKLQGLASGADDYLTKPFNPDELAARVAAVLRRTPGRAAATAPLHYGDVIIDFEQRRVMRGTREVTLTRTEWPIVVELAVNAGKVLTHRDLATRVWGVGYREDTNYLHMWMSRIRKKLGPDIPITTLQGIGYRLEPPDSGATAPH